MSTFKGIYTLYISLSFRLLDLRSSCAPMLMCRFNSSQFLSPAQHFGQLPLFQLCPRSKSIIPETIKPSSLSLLCKMKHDTMINVINLGYAAALSSELLLEENVSVPSGQLYSRVQRRCGMIESNPLSNTVRV